MQRYECQDVQAVLSGLLDGELDANSSHLAEAHLAQCAPCRTVLQQAEETDDLLRAAMSAREVWPTDLDRRIRTALFGEVDVAHLGQRRRRLVLAAWSGWSIAAIVILGSGLSLSQGWLNRSVSTDGSAARVPPPITNDDLIATTWSPPVGSEAAAMSIFNGNPEIAPIEPAQAAVKDDSLPAEMVAMNALPAEPALPQPAPVEPSVSPTMSTQTMAGFESQVQAAKWLQLLAANLPTKAPETPAPDRVEPITSQTIAAAAPRPASQDTGDVLHQASVLLSHLEQAGEGSFVDVRLVQQALSSDDVLERLAVARDNLQSADSVDLVNRAWSMLEWTTGSVDQDELERVKQSIAMQNLPTRLERLSDQYWN